MLCTQCQHIAVPETVLSGSDFAELVGWSCLALPGYLYCFWRHWNRAKACPRCGSHALMRQSRASRARIGSPVLPPPSIPIRNESGPVRWPAPLQAPRARLRNGFVGTIPSMLAIASCLFGAFGWLSPTVIATLIVLAFLSSAAWVVHQGLQLARLQTSSARCRAWDDRGKSLPIEPV